MLEPIKQLLFSVQSQAKSDFTGVGILVCDSPEELPIFPLREFVDIPLLDRIDAYLARIGGQSSSLHDGFHIVSTSFCLLRVAQYFSPPMPPNLAVSYEKPFGGRYLAAMFGSALPGVMASGIATPTFGIAIFEGGREVYFKGIA